MIRSDQSQLIVSVNFKGRASTCIDQIWCNITSENICSGILNVSTSAHLPIFSSIPTNAESLSHVDNSTSNVIKIHNICSKTIEKFNRALVEVNDEYTNKNFLDPDISPEKAMRQFNTRTTLTYRNLIMIVS